MTYFHRRPSTIIGAKAFHGPVRDGKAWDHLAMVVKRNWFASVVGEHYSANWGRSTCTSVSDVVSLPSYAVVMCVCLYKATRLFRVAGCVGFAVCLFSGTCLTLQPARL